MYVCKYHISYAAGRRKAQRHLDCTIYFDTLEEFDEFIKPYESLYERAYIKNLVDTLHLSETAVITKADVFDFKGHRHIARWTFYADKHLEWVYV